MWPLEAAFYWSLGLLVGTGFRSGFRAGIRPLASEKVGESFLSERVDNFEKEMPALECVCAKFGATVDFQRSDDRTNRPNDCYRPSRQAYNNLNWLLVKRR